MNIRILFFCPNFHPLRGGVETVALQLARGLAAQGAEVKLVTATALLNSIELEERFELIRKPSVIRLAMLVKWCSIFFHHNVSIRGLWPLALFKRKWVVLHHLTYYQQDGTITASDWIKRQLSRFAHTICCSEFVSSTLPRRGVVLNNPFQEDVFTQLHTTRANDLIFAGRLVNDKGLIMLLKALTIVRDRYNLYPKLVVAGDGPQRQEAERITTSMGLAGSVIYKGMLNARQLAAELNISKILVVPSVYKEPFGMVVIEGLACGCMPVTTGAGLLEASGGIGLHVRNGDIDDLASKLVIGLTKIDKYKVDRHFLAQKLEKHYTAMVATTYLDYLTHLLKGNCK